MAISTHDALASGVQVDERGVHVRLRDGRTVSVPLSWFPRLSAARPEQLADWRLIGHGEGIRWPQLDEDLSVAALLAGR